jgi:hypothetical protein
MTDDKQLLEHLFGKPALAAVEEDRLRQMAKEYPYFPHVYWMLAARTGNGKSEGSPADIHRAAAYAFHPLRLQQYLPGHTGEKEAVVPPAPSVSAGTPAAEAGAVRADGAGAESRTAGAAATADQLADQAPPASSAPLIQPLFTRDYFAYTGTRLPDHIENDKRPTMEQLHSFTDWLRAMKRPKGSVDPDVEKDAASRAARDESEHAEIRVSAATSVETADEVYTEAMAEVRAAKGQIDKAIAIYEKLSLSSPEKSPYFAQKIEALKHK